MTQKIREPRLARCFPQWAKRASRDKMNQLSINSMNISSTTMCVSPDRNTSCITFMPPPVSLLNLPTELHLILCDLLDYESLLKLGATSTHFRSMICREHIVAALYKDEDVIRHRSMIRNERLACFKCYRLRSAFFDFDERGIMPKFTVTGGEAGRRRCLICLMPTSPPMEKVVDPKRSKRCSGTPGDD